MFSGIFNRAVGRDPVRKCPVRSCHPRFRKSAHYCDAEVFRLLDRIGPVQSADHFCVQILRKLQDLLLLTLYISAVEDQSSQLCVAPLFKPLYCQSDVCRRVDSHVFSRRQDVHFTRVPLPHGHGKSAAYHIAQNVIENDVGSVFCQNTFLPQGLQRRYDTTACTALSRRRSPGFRTDDPAASGSLPDKYDFIELKGFTPSDHLHDRRQHMPAAQAHGRIRLGITADLQHCHPAIRPVLG